MKTIKNISIGFSEYNIPKYVHSKSVIEKISYLNSIARENRNTLGYFKTDLTIEFVENESFKFRFDMGDGRTLEDMFGKYFGEWQLENSVQKPV
jgi:hypothetical protein